MKILRIAAVAALTAFSGITGGASLVHAAPATGVLLGAPAVKTMQSRHRAIDRVVASNGPGGAARRGHDLSSYVWPAGWRATAILTYFLLSE